MIRIKCPFCGERDHSEFTYGNDGSIEYPSLDAPTEDWVKAIFFRKNISGMQLETWHHTSGCRLWLYVKRNTVTHEIESVEPCHTHIRKFLGEDK